jgi:hypothetical protein
VSAFPSWLRMIWLFIFPFSLLFAVRITWEKTVWTWARGPQMVGFSLMHVHPFLFIVGALCCYGMMVWLVPAAIYLIKRRNKISPKDILTTVLSLLVVVALLIPDDFFA